MPTVGTVLYVNLDAQGHVANGDPRGLSSGVFLASVYAKFCSIGRLPVSVPGHRTVALCPSLLLNPRFFMRSSGLDTRDTADTVLLDAFEPQVCPSPGHHSRGIPPDRQRLRQRMAMPPFGCFCLLRFLLPTRLLLLVRKKPGKNVTDLFISPLSILAQAKQAEFFSPLASPPVLSPSSP